MRPKTRILLIDTNEDRQSVRRFQFDLWRFAVESASSAAEARDLAAQGSHGLIVAAYPVVGIDLGCLLDELHRIAPYTPSMVLADKGNEALMALHADAVLTRPTSPAEILERAKVMSARKRGPRKGTPYHSKQVLPAVATVDVRRIA